MMLRLLTSMGRDVQTGKWSFIVLVRTPRSGSSKAQQVHVTRICF